MYGKNYHMHSFMPVGLFMCLFVNDFFYLDVCCCCHLMMFYDWRECVMSVLGTKKTTTTNIPRAIVLTLGNKVVMYCNLYLHDMKT